MIVKLLRLIGTTVAATALFFVGGGIAHAACMAGTYPSVPQVPEARWETQFRIVVADEDVALFAAEDFVASDCSGLLFSGDSLVTYRDEICWRARSLPEGVLRQFESGLGVPLVSLCETAEKAVGAWAGTGAGGAS